MPRLTPEERARTECLVALCPECRAVIMASVMSNPKERREAGRAAGRMAAQGYFIETWTVERVRAATFDCEHAQARRERRKPKRERAQQTDLLEVGS